MEFIWDDTYADIGWYECKLIDEDSEIDSIVFNDYTNYWQQENANESHYYRAHSFEVSYCCGYSMKKYFDYDNAYRNHIDLNGERMYGYNGVCTHTVEDVKRWCENYLAQKYIDEYNNILARLDTAKRRASWFVENGYGQND